jgi:hypothetical protein
MKKIVFLTMLIAMMSSCADQNKRLLSLKKMYPSCKVEPSTGLLQNQGFDFILIDSTNQIIGVSFYPWSETKIQSLRNIR